MENAHIADIFDEIADILEIQGDSVFRIRSYRRASQVIRNFPYNIREMYEKNPAELREIPGIGEHLALKIEEILKTGQCKAHQKLVKKIGEGLLQILRLRGVGPKKVKLFFKELAIDNVKKLEHAARRGVLRGLPGMGVKSEQEVLKSILDLEKFSERTPLYLATLHAEEYVDYMKKCRAVSRVEIAGSLRRRLETVGDLDILVIPRDNATSFAMTSSDATKVRSTKKEVTGVAGVAGVTGVAGKISADARSRKKISAKHHANAQHVKIIDHFCTYPEVRKILAQGDTKASVLLRSGMQADLRVVDKESFGAALQYFIGSKTHNVAIRNRAKRKGLKISEYGVFRGSRMIAGASEESVYQAVGLPYIIPELRENRGEIEAAARGELPKTLELRDIKGDLHMHTKATDGSNSISELAREAQGIGYSYIAITDHSKGVGVVHGFDENELLHQIREIEKAQRAMKRFRILSGIEVDIRKNGELTLSDKILEKLDIVVASVHSAMELPSEEQTERVIRALQHPCVNILGHPTARLLGKRNPMELDMERVMKAAKEHRVALELNANPLRLDLSDVHCRMAKDLGVKVVISTDSHHFTQFDFMEFGVFTARRGWLEKKDVLNTRSAQRLLAYWK